MREEKEPEINPDDTEALKGEVRRLREENERLREAETENGYYLRRYRGLIASIPEWLWETDERLTFTWCSDRAEDVLGYQSEELCGRSLPDVLAPEDVTRVVRRMEHAFRSGTPFRELEAEFVDRNGNRVCLILFGGPVSDAQGGFRGMRGTGRDITARKRAEDVLRASETRYSELADSLPQTVFDIDDTGWIVFANRFAFEMFGYDHADMELGLNALQMFTPEDRDRVAEDIRRSLAGTDDPSAEYRALRKDGTTFPVLVYSTPTIRENGASGLRGVIVDISDRKRTERLMERVRDLALEMGSTTNLREGLRLCLRAALEISGIESGGFYLASPEGGLRLEVHEGLSPEFASVVSAFSANSPNTRLVMPGNPVYSATADLPTEVAESSIREGLRFVAVLPIQHSKRVIGCLNLGARSTEVIPAVIRDALEGMVAQVGNSIGRLQAEAALSRNEEQYRTLVENSTDVVLRFDREFRHLFASKSVRDVTGLDPADFIGKTHREMKFPEDLCKYWEGRIQRVFESGREHVEKFRFEGAAGTVIFDWKLIPERSEKGALVSVLSISRNVTEETRMQEALRLSESRFLFIADQLPGVMWTTDRDMVFTFAAGTGLAALGMTSPLMMGRQAGEFFAPEKQGETSAAMHCRALAGETVQYSCRHSELHFEARLEPLRDGTGAVVGVLGLAIDVSARESERARAKRLEAQLLQSQKLETIGRFAGGIAHDFNNILTVILTQAEVALMLMHDDDPLQEAFLEIRKAGKRAAELTRKLLVFSRKEKSEPRIVSLNHILLEMDKMFRRLIGENIELVTIPDEDLRPVRIDPGHMEQVLTNLVVNARDAMPGGGRLVIETRNISMDEKESGQHPETVPGKQVLLSVTDTGSGMDEETLARAFEPFFTTKPHGHGTGLGLSTCYGIVKQNQGNIWIESTPGRKTAVYVCLPAMEGSPIHLSAPAVVEALPVGTETVLVAEDDPSIRLLVVRLLTGAGYRVHAASNGTDALALAKGLSEPLDLLITDVIMPLMGGPVLAEQFASLYPQTRVLFMSGYTDGSIVHQGVLNPGIMLIQKPFSTAAFMHKVRNVLDGAWE